MYISISFTYNESNPPWGATVLHYYRKALGWAKDKHPEEIRRNADGSPRPIARTLAERRNKASKTPGQRHSMTRIVSHAATHQSLTTDPVPERPVAANTAQRKAKAVWTQLDADMSGSLKGINYPNPTGPRMPDVPRMAAMLTPVVVFRRGSRGTCGMGLGAHEWWWRWRVHHPIREA